MTSLALTPAQFKRMQEAAFRANPPQVMDVPELAAFLGVSEDTVRAKTQEGIIPAKYLGKRVLYYLETIREWLRRGQELGS